MGWDGRIGMGVGIIWVTYSGGMEGLIEQWPQMGELTSIYILYRRTDGRYPVEKLSCTTSRIAKNITLNHPR